MPIGDRNTADNRTYDTDISLICPADVEVFDGGGPIRVFVWRTVDCTIFVPGKPSDGSWREKIGINDVPAQIRHKSNG